MPDSRIIPTPDTPSVCTFTILSEGSEVPREYQVLSIMVHRAVNRIPTATLIIRDGDAASQDFDLSNEDFFIPGKSIEIKAGYRGSDDPIFSGKVVKHALRVREQRSILEVTCKDPVFSMTLNPQCRYFREQTDSDVMEEIIQQAGLSSDVEATSENKYEIIQYNCTDWDFVLTRADALGKICLVDDGKLNIAAPDISQEAALTLSFGATLLEFEAEIDARSQYKSVSSKAWSMSNSEIVEADESAVQSTSAGNLDADTLAETHGVDRLDQKHGGNLSEQELQDASKARLLKSRLARIRGRAKFQGVASLAPGQIVELQGVGDRFNGKVFLSAVRHEISDGNWITDVEFGLDDSWFVERFQVTQPRAAGLIPPISGLQIGIVTQIADDPLGENRIMVRLPLIDDQDEGSWARIATLDAGNDRGSFFLPEIDDEVVVGFLHDDPRHPVVLGMLHSSSRAAPLTATEDNHEKGIRTRSGMNLLFNDDQKNILLDTPDGNKVEISGEDQSITLEDQHGNKIVMDSNGITIESSADLVLKAQMNLEGEGGVGLSMKGSASAEISASGTMKIEGSLVQIN